MYDPVLPQHAADVLSQLFALFRKAPGKDLHRLNPDVDGLSPNLLMNLRQHRSIPSPRQLHALRLSLSMTIGGVFKLFGYSLDSMRKVEFLLNGERTRLVESYPFNRDRAVDLPGTLGEYGSFQRNAFLSELVVGWQQGVPSVRFTSLTGKRKDFCMCNSGPVTRWHCRGFRQAPISRFGQLTGRSVRVPPPNKSTFSSTAVGIYVAVAQFAKVSY